MVLTPNAASMRQCREGHLPADPLHVRLIRVELESGEVEVLITSLRDKRVFDLVKDFGTSESPKSTRSSTTHWCPGRPGHPAFRHNIASSLRLHTGLPYDWTPRSDAPLGSPLAPSARRVSRVASRLPGTTRLRFALHGGQRTKAYPYCAFAKLYALRWGIEENYKREKQRLEIENFSGRTPWVLLQDFHAKIFAQNLTAIFVRLAQWLADARYQHRRHGYRINFANALSKMKNNLVRLFLETSPLELSWRLLQRMADAVEAVRPGRKFPRDMKKVRVPGFQMQYRRTR